MVLGGGHDDAERGRFRAEAEAAANLDHPHIVPIYEVGEHDGRPFYSMKLIEGTSLAQELPRFRHDPRGAARLLALVARAVHHAHQRGLLHRDLKPANVLLDRDGQPHVTDFGLAKKIEGDGGLTQSGAIVGTPEYMAPEQARGQKGLTVAADVYALGAVLYALLTGRPPFKGAHILETLRQTIETEATPPRVHHPQVNRDLEVICLKCLEKDPAKRYGAAEALALDLERWLAVEPIVARPVGRGERLAKWVRRRPQIAALWGTVVLVAAVGLGAFAWAYGQNLESLDEANTERSNTARALVDTEKARQDALQGKKKAQDEKQIAFEATQRAKEATKTAENQTSIANNLRKLEETVRKQKERELLRAESLLYDSHFQDAYQHFLNHDLVQCRRTLDECRWDFRGLEYGCLVKQMHNKAGDLVGHVYGISSLLVSADGKRLISGSYDATIKVWDLETGKDTLTLRGHTKGVATLALGKDGKRLISGSEDQTIKVWDLDAGGP
jgi:serine/threonine protein kinase